VLGITFDVAAMPSPGLGSASWIRTTDKNQFGALSGFETFFPRFRVVFEHNCSASGTLWFTSIPTPRMQNEQSALSASLFMPVRSALYPKHHHLLG
jgi:hypothetical protein